MPDIFNKNQKFHVIEYGGDQQGFEGLDAISKKLVGFIQDIIAK